jgi:hypothetical protein
MADDSQLVLSPAEINVARLMVDYRAIRRSAESIWMQGGKETWLPRDTKNSYYAALTSPVTFWQGDSQFAMGLARRAEVSDNFKQVLVALGLDGGLSDNVRAMKFQMAFDRAYQFDQQLGNDTMLFNAITEGLIAVAGGKEKFKEVLASITLRDANGNEVKDASGNPIHPYRREERPLNPDGTLPGWIDPNNPDVKKLEEIERAGSEGKVAIAAPDGTVTPTDPLCYDLRMVVRHDLNAVLKKLGRSEEDIKRIASSSSESERAIKEILADPDKIKKAAEASNSVLQAILVRDGRMTEEAALAIVSDPVRRAAELNKPENFQWPAPTGSTAPAKPIACEMVL